MAIDVPNQMTPAPADAGDWKPVSEKVPARVERHGKREAKKFGSNKQVYHVVAHLAYQSLSAGAIRRLWRKAHKQYPHGNPRRGRGNRLRATG
ncbi:MAG TPA: hypothetical protein VF796_26805 [Humisphaera sp.]